MGDVGMMRLCTCPEGGWHAELVSTRSSCPAPLPGGRCLPGPTLAEATAPHGHSGHLSFSLEVGFRVRSRLGDGQPRKVPQLCPPGLCPACGSSAPCWKAGGVDECRFPWLVPPAGRGPALRPLMSCFSTPPPQPGEHPAVRCGPLHRAGRLHPGCLHRQLCGQGPGDRSQEAAAPEWPGLRGLLVR